MKNNHFALLIIVAILFAILSALPSIVIFTKAFKESGKALSNPVQTEQLDQDPVSGD